MYKRQQVRYYKDHGLVCAHGDHYRLTDPEKEREYTAFMSVSADKKAAVVAYVQRVSGANKGIKMCIRDSNRREE